MPIHCVRNRIFPSRYYPDPRLSLYALPFNDGEGGKLRNHITGEDATLSGGSTLLAQEKFRNDFQRLTSTFPSLAYRASGAVTNLLYALNPDNPSFEGGTVGGWTLADFGTGSVDSTWSTHGVNSNKVTVGAGTGGWAGQVLNVAAATANNTQYTFAARVKSNVAKTIRVALYDEVDGYTATNYAFAAGEERLLAVTKTFDPTDTAVIRRAHIQFVGTAAAGDIFYMDSLILTAGATVPQFEESERVASEAYFANPVPAGAPVSGIVFLWVPYNGNDNTEHNYLDCRDATPLGWRLYKSAANNLLIETTAAAGIKSMGGAVDNINMARGRMHTVAFSIHEDNTQHLALNGTLLTTSAGAAGREAAVNANLYVGSDKDGANHGNCLLLPYVYEVPWSAAECEYYSTLQAPPPRTRMVA